MNKGTSQYPKCVLITFVFVVCVFRCFQVFYVRSKPLQRWWSGFASMLGPQGLSNGEFRWVKVETVGFPMNIWRWVSLLNVGFMILWYSKNWNPEIWKFPEEKKSLHSLNSAIKELVYSFFNFDSEETSRISDKKKTQTMQQKRRHIKTGQTTRLWQTGFWASYDRFAKGGTEATIVGVDGDGDLHVFSEIHGTQVTRQRCFRSQFFSQSLMKLYEIHLFRQKLKILHLIHTFI